jgi:hypothetical protein
LVRSPGGPQGQPGPGALYRVALVRRDVSENISSPSADFLRVIGFHSFFTVESMLTNISIEEYKLWPKIKKLIDAAVKAF